MWSLAIKLLKSFWPLALVVIIFLGLFFGFKLYGSNRFEAGRLSYKAEVAAENLRIERALQEEKDRADARYRGAILARQAIEKTLSDRDDRIKRLLSELRTKQSTAPGNQPGVDGTGVDWIGIFGACYSEYYELGKDAARLADKVGGLQDYINLLSNPK